MAAGRQLEHIRHQLAEVLGERAAAAIGARRVQELLALYGAGEGAVNSVINTILEGFFEGGEGKEEEFVVFKQEEVAEAASASMGCGSSHVSPSDPLLAATSESAMLCDMCSIKFSLMTRKKTCSECSNYFCSSCLPREQGCRTRTCTRCRVLHKRPPQRGDLMKLRVKDLQLFLTKRRINIKACVEKKDLVELVLQHSCPPEATEPEEDERSSRLPGSRSYEDSSIRVSDQVPLERSSNFPQNYTDSSHRRDWFQEKFGPNSESSTPSDTEPQEVSMEDETPVEKLEDSDPELEETRVEELQREEDTAQEDDAQMTEADEIISVEVEESDGARAGEPEPSDAKEVKSGEINEEVTEVSPPDVTMETVGEVKEVVNPTEDEEDNEESSEGAVGGETGRPLLGARLATPLLADLESSSAPSSPRRFANQGMVYLSEIKGVEDLRELSTKQIKELLAMNRVNFKGCVEKEELVRIVERLWQQEQRHREEGDTMDDDAMCKICMDSPIDCVMLECGHMCTCTQCGKQMAECPICRQYVVRVVKTFKA